MFLRGLATLALGVLFVSNASSSTPTVRANLLGDARLDIAFERDPGEVIVLELTDSASGLTHALVVIRGLGDASCEHCDSALEWSPDGRRLLLATGAQGLQVMDRRGLLHTPGHSVGFCDGSGHATLSPLKNEVACEVGDGFTVPRVAPGTFSDQGIGSTAKWGPAWSPDGASLAYVEGIGAVQRLEIYSLKTRKSRALPVARSLILAPAWSHDGRWLSFANSCQAPGCDFEIWIVRTDGTGLRRVAKHGMRPAWSPDGRHIAFDSYRNGDSEIYTVDLATDKQRQLTRNHVDDVNPAWR
jgi:WD40 repeat protein